MVSKANNIQWLDSLRTLALLGVIIIHISSPLVNMTYGKNMPYWWIGNVVDSAVRFAVPLFLMLSGATLLGKKYNLNEFYKRRFSRVLIPFLFWMVVYWIYRWVMLMPNQQPRELHGIVQWATGLFLTEGISKHFWYIYMILIIYLFVPFMGKGLRKLNMQVISNLILLWVVTTFALKSVPLNMYGWSGEYGSKLLGCFLYSGYLVLGYYLSKLPILSKRIRITAAGIFIMSVLVSAVTTYFFSKNAHKLDLSMYNYLSVNTIIQSIAVFMCIKDTRFKNKHTTGINHSISNYSYGIYLVHIMVIGVLFRNGIYWNFTYPLFSLPAIVIITLITSFGIIYILRKIPLGKYVAG
ncbi:MAG: acyltransferase family protein [Bacteroidales bacterium]|nr:acyltransferase family protein [Bacteroidales bacterium]